ncbi:hypothetical protein SAMN05428970_1286 [Agromyces sp. CF514]|uniref:hypothetical protein n=1 Tax=Agromyces sp. CF514 TaxID=1881031 RepID=UPI0008EF334B|nr:hypothetical protein [Agromyces sp. CF514]SFR72014.1 hypothetical protein SAMN05428970_1286 [Agromyces sp. CF514]
MTEALDEWSEFNVAMVGATAALAGLLIVAMSVNIGTILKSATLPARAAVGIATLVLAIAVTGLALAPEQPSAVYGGVVLVLTLLVGGFQVHAIRVIRADSSEHHGTPAQQLAKSIVGTLPLGLYLAGAIALLAGAVVVGLWLLAVATILAIAAAILYSWVVLIEVLR